MATNTLGEWSDGDDDWIWEIDESTFLPETTATNTQSTFLPETTATNTLGEWSDGDDDWIWEIDESTFLPETTTTNTSGEFSDGEGDWSNSEDDDLIRNINEDEVLRGLNDGDGDLIRNIDAEGSLSNPSGDDLSYDLEDEQTGRGEKRKSDEQLLPVESGEDYYSIETKKKHHSKKFDLTPTDHIVRFNNALHDVDLLESYERTQAIFHHLLADVTRDMAKKDQVRFVLRSEQLETPISIPFLPLEELTPEKIFSQIERVIQSNEDFRLNDTVTVDIIHVVTPEGRGKSKVKRTTLNIREYLKKKKSVIPINNTDNLCLARALSVAIARIEKDPKYLQISSSKAHIQLQRALDLHQAANVPLGPCGMDEVKLFQQYLTNY